MQEIWSWFAIDVEWARAALDFLGKIAWPLAAAIVLWHWRDVIKNMLSDRDLESLELTVSGLILKRSVTESLDEAEQSLAEEALPRSVPPDTGSNTSAESDAPTPATSPLEKELEKERKWQQKVSGCKVCDSTSGRANLKQYEAASSYRNAVLLENASLVAAATARMLITYGELEQALRDAIMATGGVPQRSIDRLKQTEISIDLLGTKELIDLAYSRGLLPPNQLKALLEVRKIRNELAHQGYNQRLLTDAEVVRFVDICHQLIKHLSAATDSWEPPQEEKP